MIDWHCHVLPGLDDGPKVIEQALAMAGALAGYGFTSVYCTPHQIRGCYEADNDKVRQGIIELQQLIDANNITLKLLPGREYYLDEYLLTALEDPLPLGDSKLILVEIPPGITAEMVRRILYEVVRSGFTPVIAHPERCPLLVPSGRTPEKPGIRDSISRFLTGRVLHTPPEPPDVAGNSLLNYLRELGCSFQGNLGSFTGFYGHQVKIAADTLQSMGIYDRYGSDLHAPEHAKNIFRKYPV